MGQSSNTEAKTLGLILVVILLILDVAYIVLRVHDYYFIFLKYTGHTYPIALNILILCLIPILTKRSWVFILPICLVPFFLIVIYLIPLYEKKFEYLEAPNKTETLIIKHWSATLGETTYVYEFYKQMDNIGLIMKKLVNQDLSFMVPAREKINNDNQVLDMHNAKWITEKKVVFPSRDGEKEIVLE